MRTRMRFRALTVTIEGNAEDAAQVLAQAMLGALRAPEPGDDEAPVPELDEPPPAPPAKRARARK